MFPSELGDVILSDEGDRFVPSVPVSAVSVAFIGFFIGPIFPCAVALATKVLPGHLHVSVIGFIAAFGIKPIDN